METSEYIHPFSPFQDLTRKKKQWKIQAERVISTDDLVSLVAESPVPCPRVSGDSPEERIVSVLRDDEIRLGPLTFDPDRHAAWVERVRTSTSLGRPVPFVVMACPFKVPVPLKTDRVLADMGEALFLRRMASLCDLVAEVYPPGATVTVVSEGILGKFTGVGTSVYEGYLASVRRLASLLGVTDRIKFVDLADMQKAVPRFDGEWIGQYVSLARSFSDQDPEFMEEFRAAYRSLVRMVNTKGHPEKLLMDVYDFDIPVERLSVKARKIRHSILVDGKDAVFWVRAFLRARDRSGYLEKVVPGHVKLTVSHKLDELAVHAMNRRSVILPYQGVPVLQAKRGEFSVEYLTNLKRSRRPYEVTYLEGDADPAPFFYETIR